MPLNKPKTEEKEGKKVVIDKPIKTKKVPISPRKPQIQRVNSNEIKKLEDKIQSLVNLYTNVEYKLDELTAEREIKPDNSKLLEECAIRFRDLISWQRFSNKTAMGRKMRELLERIDKSTL